MRSGPGLRVSGGWLRGRGLVTPRGIRPSGARLREALMSIWSERLPGARVLDLYAGSGAMGIEALSRGAASVTFVESDRQSLAALRKNFELVPPSAVRVEALAAERALERLHRQDAQFDLLFADPPYDFVPTESLFAALAAVAAPEARLAFEHRTSSSAVPFGRAWREVGRRNYGDAALLLLEAADPVAS